MGSNPISSAKNKENSMHEMKYVVTRDEDGKEHLFIFPKCFNHDQFSEVLSYIKVGSEHNWERQFQEVISAGFTDGVSCYGRSESLDIDSRSEDSLLLTTLNC